MLNIPPEIRKEGKKSTKLFVLGKYEQSRFSFNVVTQKRGDVKKVE